MKNEGQCGWLYPLDASQDKIKAITQIMVESQENLVLL